MLFQRSTSSSLMPKVTHFLVHSPLHTHTHARYGESESLTFPFKFVPPLLNKKKNDSVSFSSWRGFFPSLLVASRSYWGRMNVRMFPNVILLGSSHHPFSFFSVSRPSFFYVFSRFQKKKKLELNQVQNLTCTVQDKKGPPQKKKKLIHSPDGDPLRLRRPSRATQVFGV